MKNGKNNTNINNNKMMKIKQANKLVLEAVFNKDLCFLMYLFSEKTDIMKAIDTHNNKHSPLKL